MPHHQNDQKSLGDLSFPQLNGAALTTNAWRGAAASLGASTVMGALMLGLRKTGVLGEPPPRKLTRKLLRFVQAPRGARGADAATVFAHLGYGAGAGAIFGALATPLHDTKPRVLAGVAFGAALWAVSYAGWIPALGLMPPPRRDRLGRPAAMLLAHAVFGATLGLLFRPKAKPVAARARLTQDEALDEELGESFPASDPPSMTQPHSPHR